MAATSTRALGNSSVAQLSDLIGRVSATSDCVATKNRLVYVQQTVIQPNQYIRLVLSRLGPNSLLDCRNIRLRCTVTVSSSDPFCVVDCNQIFPFYRTRISSATTVLSDVLEAHLLNSICYNSTASVTEAVYEQSLVGDLSLTQKILNASNPAGVEYLFPIFQQNTVLRGAHFMDMNSADMIVELWTQTPQQYLYSATDANATYTISNLQLLSEYVSSPSLGAFYRSNPMQFSCWDWRQLYSTLSNAVENVRWPSSSSSWNGAFLVMRDQLVENSIANANKCDSFNTNGLVNYQLSINNQYYFDIALDSAPQWWHELVDFWKAVLAAKFYDLTYTQAVGGCFVIGISVAALPVDFGMKIKSGVLTSALNQDPYFILQFAAPLGTTQRCDTYLQSTVTISSQGPGRELMITY